MNKPHVRCGLGAQAPWVQTMHFIQSFLWVILFIYCPVIPFLLPDFIFSLQRECEKEDSNEKQAARHNQVMLDQQTDLHREGDTDNYARQINNNVSSEQQHEMEQRNDLEGERTDQNDSYNGGNINPYGELLTVVRKGQEEALREIPLDDASPITFGGLLSDYVKELPELNINFNLKMLFLCFVVLPFFLHLKFALMIFRRLDSYEEFFQKTGNCRGSRIYELIVCSIVADPQQGIQTYQSTMELIGWVVLFVLLLCITPRDLLYRSCVMTYCSIPNCQSVSLGHEIRRHLNAQHHWAYDLTFFVLWGYIRTLKKCFVEFILNRRKIRQWRRVFRSLYYLYSIPLGVLVGLALGAVVLVIFLIAMGILLAVLSPLATLLWFITKKTWESQFRMAKLFQDKCNPYVIAILTALMGLVASLSAFYLINAVLSVSVLFMVRIFLYTVMGLVLNAEMVTPDVAFILVVWRNMYICYSNLQSRYREVKDMIAKHWKETTEELPRLDNGNDETIPKELFWFVCGKGKSDFQKNILPLRAEICFMLRDMALILTFLSVSLFATLVFKSMNDLSALVSTIFVFVSGVIPSLVFQGFTKKEKFIGWDKIKIEKKIKEAVNEYINKKKEGALGSDCSGSFHWFQYDSDNEYDFGSASFDC